jgi:hypothetical protein
MGFITDPLGTTLQYVRILSAWLLARLERLLTSFRRIRPVIQLASGKWAGLSKGMPVGPEKVRLSLLYAC